MSISRLPAELLALIVDYADIYSIFNLGLTCYHLNQHIHRDENIGRIALKKANYSTEATVANATKKFASGFRRLAKRRMAVRSAEPWTVAIIAMADRFICTDGYLCYTVNEKHLRILNIRQPRAMELVVNSQVLVRDVVRNFNRSVPYTFEPLYCAKGILSCLATQVDGQHTYCWLIIFEAKDTFNWVVVERMSPEHQILIRNNEEYLFCITKSHAGIDGSMRWALKRLDHRTRQWSDDKIILWGIDGTKAGEDICFEIIDHYLYCVSLERRHQRDYGLRDRFYQAVRFPVNEATPGSLENLSKRHLWRRHDSEGHIDERWASLQLNKDESTGDIFIVEIRQEWPSKRLEFGQSHENSREPPLTTLSISNGSSHVDANQISATTHTRSHCPLHTYNPSCDAFVDLVYGENSTEHFLQLRVHPKVDILQQDKTVKLWPEKPHPSQPDDALTQLHEIMNLSHSTEDVEWAMDERTLVYSHRLSLGQPHGQLRPITLISFDSSFRFPGLPKYPSSTTNGDRASLVQHRRSEPSQESANVGPGDVAIVPPSGSLGGLPSDSENESTSPFISLRAPIYQSMGIETGTQYGFDMSHGHGTAVIT
ncbi:hypothetical protein NCS52_01593400 [Fusarium sp. LHS14.1]|nr:hypothetical protein NCS52_01593400 [Fusarium sp. LHS14.1]